MREFVYFSKNAVTTGNFKDLKKAGRMDIVCNFILHAFFVSNAIREDVKLHLIFYGQPNPPKHIILDSRAGKLISKKDIAGLIKRILYKGEKKKDVFPGCYIETKSFLDVIQDLIDKGKKIKILERRGKDIRDLEKNELINSVFVIGDQDGLPKKELRRLKNKTEKISIGNITYFASQTLTIIQNELDRLN